jgi:hypothetical protein
MKRKSILLLVLCTTAGWFVYNRSSQPALAGIAGYAQNKRGTSLVLLSDSYRIDRIFQSMQGPYTAHGDLALLPQGEPELLWITGTESEPMNKSATKKISEEFFCHANLSLDQSANSPKAHNEQFGTSLDWRLFTLVPGKRSIHLPEGYGIPVSSHEKFDFVSMSLNLNETDPDFQMRFKSQIHFVRESEMPGKMKPLFLRSLFVVVPILKGTNGGQMLPEAVCAMPGSTNSVGRVSQGMACAPPSLTASEGGIRGTNTLHWMVPPGRHTYISDVTSQMLLKFDTTMHYATGHLHPMGEGLILRDVTTGETILRINSKDYIDKKGVASMEEFTFPEGIKIYKDHQYELETTYNNRTDQHADVMAIVYAYLLDKNFDRAEAAVLKNTTSARAGHVEKGM